MGAAASSGASSFALFHLPGAPEAFSRHAAAFRANPILPGHTLVAPKKCTDRLKKLSDQEFDDLFRLVKKIQKRTEKQAMATSSNIIIKDGAMAGQPVPHLHVHLVPRKGPQDFEYKDQIFEAVDAWVPSRHAQATHQTVQKPPIPADSERRDRTTDEMAAEAAEYRKIQKLPMEMKEPHFFGRIRIDPSFIFASSPSQGTLAFVNLRPLLAGHVLVTPKRAVARLCELTGEESADLWRTVRQVQSTVEAYHGADASEIGVQDGKAAGQTVAHVHVHILPRK